MKLCVRLLCVFFAFSALSAAGDYKWLRRASTIAVCAASAFDVWSTHYAVSGGAVESNGLFSNNGGVRWGRAGLVKVGFCAGQWIAGEMHLLDRNNHARSDKLMSILQFGTAGAFMYIGMHNKSVGDSLRERPSYLVSQP